MTRIFASITVFGLLLIPVSASAEPREERVLLPVTLRFNEPIPGAHGSLWRSELVARNTGDKSVWVERIGYDCGGLPCGPGWYVSPHATMLLSAAAASDRFAAILTVGGWGDFGTPTPGESDELVFMLRIQDISRQSETWGTEVPVIRERDLFASKLFLPNVPVTSGFRNTLRIYHMEGGDAEVLVRVFATALHRPAFSNPADPDPLLGERVMRLAAPQPGQESSSPGYLEIGDLNAIAPLGDAERVTIQIEPVTPDLRYWAFVSVTNNATQHVTTVTPDRPLGD